MFIRKNLLAIFGVAAMVAGLLVFGVTREFSANWARWTFGPLLWFIGFALTIGWGVLFLSNLASNKDEDKGSRVSKTAGRGH